MATEHYEYLAVNQVQCPRCGKLNEIALFVHTDVSLEYTGVCETELDGGGTCSTSLVLEVTSHVFPVQQG